MFLCLFRLVSEKESSADCRMRNVMTRLNKEIAILFPENEDFRAKEMLIVNWDNVGRSDIGSVRT